MQKAHIGIIGLAVMGANLARNFASKKIQTVVYNRTKERTEEFIAEHGNDYLEGCFDLEGFIQSIQTPRKILIMVQAGNAVDNVIEQLIPYLTKGDIIIDGGNTYYKDTVRREELLKKKNIHFVGCGISGGEEGALHGPSLMPGGSKEAWKEIKPLLEKIAAQDFQGQPCVTHIGTGAAGHYVKMAHNGIEYGIMQLIAEAYNLLQIWPPQAAPDIAKIFEKWNKGKLHSFLFTIVPTLLRKEDPLNKNNTKTYLIDRILDKAEQKGTGTWTVQEALSLGVAVPTIAEAVFARAVSSNHDLRQKLHRHFDFMSPHQKTYKLEEFHQKLENALHTRILLTYIQGLELISEASKANGWNVNLAEITRIWQGGCIIRADILKPISTTLKKEIMAPIMGKYFLEELKKHMDDLKDILHLTSETFIATPALSASLSYFNGLSASVGPANIIQAMRDYFGAHTYERTDKKGKFHTEWLE